MCYAVSRYEEPHNTGKLAANRRFAVKAVASPCPAGI